MSPPPRFAVIGARRGRSFINSTHAIPEQAQLVAVCDNYAPALDSMRDLANMKFYNDYRQVLDDPDIDAICLATPSPQHANQTVQALEAGKHVLSEVTACNTLEDGWALIEAVEKTGLTYMMAENYCFMRPILMVQNMVEAGLFGELTYAMGKYVHSIPDMMYQDDGSLTWRGKWFNQAYGNTYPTHSLGPICRWLGINRDDKLKTMATWTSKGRAAAHYSAIVKSQRPELQVPTNWRHGDTATTLIQTDNGALIETRFDAVSKRPHNMAQHELQGTKGCVTSPIESGADWLVWLEGYGEEEKQGVPGGWQSLNDFADEWEHPLWRAHLEAAAKAGHGGGDYFVLSEFVEAVAQNRAPLIDVYDAVTWSSVTPLSQQSVDAGCAPVAMPDYAARRQG